MDEADRVDMIQRVLDDLVTNEGVAGCGVITEEGFAVAVAASPGFVDQVGDVGTRMHELARLASVALELGPVVEHVVVGEQGTVILRPLDRREMIVVVAEAGAPLGWVRVFVTKASDRLQRALRIGFQGERS